MHVTWMSIGLGLMLGLLTVEVIVSNRRSTLLGGDCDPLPVLLNP